MNQQPQQQRQIMPTANHQPPQQPMWVPPSVGKTLVNGHPGSATGNGGGGVQLRCYLCETPKQEYSLIRSFSEIICRGCLNYEGPDKVESLIAEARRFKRQQQPIVQPQPQPQPTPAQAVALNYTRKNTAQQACSCLESRNLGNNDGSLFILETSRRSSQSFRTDSDDRPDVCIVESNKEAQDLSAAPRFDRSPDYAMPQRTRVNESEPAAYKRDSFAYRLSSLSPHLVPPVLARVGKRPRLDVNHYKNQIHSAAPETRSAGATLTPIEASIERNSNLSASNPGSPLSPPVEPSSARSNYTAAPRQAKNLTDSSRSQSRIVSGVVDGGGGGGGGGGGNAPSTTNTTNNRQPTKGIETSSSKQASNEVAHQNTAPALTAPGASTRVPEVGQAGHQNNGNNGHHRDAHNERPTTPQPTQSGSKTPPQAVPQGVPNPYVSFLQCMNCRERLEDRHFVQCPSVVAHKFCFGCSKESIEIQQMENKKNKQNHDRVFCPSGERCFLAAEQTPWTFMNSEIETIIRESTRQSGPVHHNGRTTGGGGGITRSPVYIPLGQRHSTGSLNGNHKHKDALDHTHSSRAGGGKKHPLVAMANATKHKSANSTSGNGAMT